MNFKKKSNINTSWKGNDYRVIITLSVVLFIFTVTPEALCPQAFTTVQITDNSKDDTQVDACIDNLGILHVVYQRDGNIYYRYIGGGAEFVSLGTAPAIAVDSLNKPYIAFTFQDSGQDKVCWVAKQNGSWGDRVTIGNGRDPDIVVDSDGSIHVAYSEISFFWDGNASSTMYANNRSGDFEIETIFQGYYSSYLSTTNTLQYYFPSIKIDSAGKYHISAYKHYLYTLWGTTINSDMWINYKTNRSGEVETLSSPSVTKTSEPFYNKNCFKLDDDGRAYVVYVFNGSLYYAEVTDTWSENFITDALEASIGCREDTVEITYSDPSNQIQYIQNSGSGFSSPILVSTGQSPVLAEGSNCIFYSKWDGHDLEIYKACESSTLPALVVNRDQLAFSATTSGITTGSQEVMIDREGEGGPIFWSVVDDSIWLSCSPTSGTNSGVISVSVSALTAGEYTGTITVSSPNVSNSPQTISVLFKVYEPGENSVPFGYFETPVHGSTVRSSIPVTGWALDDIGVESVKIYRKDDSVLVFIGDAVFVEGARPDVEQAYPGYPKNYQAGWGYMLLTNFLPNSGNGTFVLCAKATDLEGQEVTLGTKTITCDNANAVKPFGAIDTPTQGGTANGSSFTNWGWVLTPQPNSIPTDGSTIQVLVDSVSIGNPTYNLYRADIATLFPGFANSNGAVGYFSLDTTAYNNGVHTISWVATDSDGNTDGIGSRYFTIQNTGSSSPVNKIAGNNQREPIIKIEEFSNLPFNYFEPIKIEKGYGKNIKTRIIYPDDKGPAIIKIRELERVVIHISNLETGYLIVGNKIDPLPLGSTLDTKNGTFNWIPGPGFYGNYMIVFVAKDQDGELSKKEIFVNIVPKFGKK